MIKPLALSFLALSTLSFATTNEEITTATYNRAFNQATINCEYKYWLDVEPVEVIHQSFRAGEQALAQFRIGNDLVSVLATAGDKKGIVNFDINGTNFNTNLLNLDGISLELDDLLPHQAALAQRLNLYNFECSLEIGREPHYELVDKTVHINMHPHPNYDVRSGSLIGMQRELNDTTRQTLVLFDHNVRELGKIRGANFNRLMDGTYEAPTVSPREYGIPIVQFQGTEDFKVSQAGHNRYLINNPEQTIVFTGGNHNFCILNNTRRLLHGFMENPLKKSIRFEYITDAVVVQRGTWLRDGGIPRGVFKKSNLLSNVFRNMSESQRAKYVRGYYNYFRSSYLDEKKHYYSKATIRTYGASGVTIEDEVTGLGEGEILIELVYR